VIELDVALEDPVEELVGGQRIIIALVLAELGGGCALDDRDWDRAAHWRAVVLREVRGEHAGSIALRQADSS